MMTSDSTEPGRPARILLVDSRPGNLALLSRSLSKRGYEIGTADGSEQALTQLSPEPPDIIILEHMTREADAAELLEQIRERQKGKQRIPIIMVSARDEIDRKLAAFSAGVDDFVSKPYHIEELLARIEAQLRIRNLEEQVLHNERIKAVYEMAGAACHELSQPLTAIMGYTYMIMRNKDDKDPDYAMLKSLHESSQVAADVIGKIQRINNYAVKEYSEALKIIDLELAVQGPDTRPRQSQVHPSPPQD